MSPSFPNAPEATTVSSVILFHCWTEFPGGSAASTRRLVNPGDLVQAATATRTAPLFTCQQIDVVRVFADAPEASAAAVRPGTRAEVKLFDVGETTIQGSVTRVATALDPSTRTMRVEIDLPNPDEKLQPGMYARVTLGVEPHKVGAAKP